MEEHVRGERVGIVHVHPAGLPPHEISQYEARQRSRDHDQQRRGSRG